MDPGRVVGDSEVNLESAVALLDEIPSVAPRFGGAEPCGNPIESERDAAVETQTGAPFSLAHFDPWPLPRGHRPPTHPRPPRHPRRAPLERVRVDTSPYPEGFVGEYRSTAYENGCPAPQGVWCTSRLDWISSKSLPKARARSAGE